MPAIPRGRPRRYAQYEKLVANLPNAMTKRPKYVDGIGVFKGAKETTAWIKVRLTKGGVYKGTSHQPGTALEIKLGRLSSWTWDRLERERNNFQGRADRGEPLEDQPPIGFRDWAEDWLARAKTRLRSYPIVRAHIREHLLPVFGSRTVDAITVSQINDWIALKLRSQKPATVKRELDTLKAILTDAVRSGHLESNPCDHASSIRGIVGRQRFLSAEEMVRLLVAAEETAEWLPDFVIWGIHSGMRKSEIRNLLWANIQTLDDSRQFAMITTSKADQPRMVICTKTMSEVLERQRGRKQEGSEAVFPVSAMTLRRKWETARKKAGLGDVTMHDLRRTHSTHAAAAGVDLRTLAGRIGHTDLSMLQKHYAAIVGSASTEAANTIETTFTRMIQATRPGARKEG